MFKREPQHWKRSLYGRWLLRFLVTIGAMSMVWLGCGKKGPPRPPQRPLPPAVEDLRYVIRDDRVELSWTDPAAEAGHAAQPVSVKVLRAVLSDKQIKCDNCPVHFEAVAEIPLRTKASGIKGPRTLSYSEDIDPGCRYIYKVVVYDEYGIAGKHSNVVQFDH